ncbi:hypothetical protein BT93_L1801 [Corymbia citriodora subsp. variegata]|uniref:Uncharacterized protein n=1 Tax=Corymbia citriodora subsp. variegata TaxID=360336 RepID=A0A8T0CN17_CORYI|nr:hypothetical protein BT93_L1801 [Corymbia citriodora subsp. variegata]
MELQLKKSSIIATRLWKIVKIAFVMIRKGLMSKRNFINDMIDEARDRKLMRESSRSLSFNHYNNSRKMRRIGLNEYEYEFSCSNSPNPVIVHSAKKKSHRFPCMRLPKVIEDFVEDEPAHPETLVFMAKTPEYTFNIQIERRSPLKSPYSVRVSNYSNYSSDDEADGKYGQVDDKAEEFIRRFHDQLRKQIVH